MANIAGKEVGNNDLMIVGGGALLFIVSFFHWSGDKVCVKEGAIKQCVSGFGGVGGANGWGSGFLGWFGLLLLLAAVVWTALGIFTTVVLPKLPVPAAMAVLALTALGALLIVLRLLLGYSGDVAGAHYTVSRGFMLYVAVILSLVVTAGAFLNFTTGGGKFSDFKELKDGFGGGGEAPPAAPPAV